MASTTQKLIVIVGATGAQGGSVLDTFLTNPDYRIRALTRDSNSTKAKALASRSPNIEVVSANLSDPESLTKAFQDATSIFAVTDWMAIFQDPATHATPPPPGQSANQYACTLETKQAQNVFDVAATIPTLERLLYSTLPHISKLSNGKYTHSYHFDSKALAVEYLQSKHPQLWKQTSLIQMGAYLENYLTLPLFQPRKESETGEIVFDVLGSGEGPEMQWPYVAAQEDAGRVVQTLIDEVPAGKNVLVYRELTPFSSFVKTFEKVTGTKARIQYGKQLEGMPEDLKLQFEDTFAYAKEFGYAATDGSVIAPKELVAGYELGTVEEWIGKQNWSSVLEH